MAMHSNLVLIVLCLAAPSALGAGPAVGDVPQPPPGSQEGQMLQQLKTEAGAGRATRNWVLVVRQTMPYLFEQDQWSLNEGDPNSTNYAYFGSLESCRTEDGMFTFKLSWPSLEDQIWQQCSNPVHGHSHGGVGNYEEIQVPYTGHRWGGLERSGDNALLDGSARSWDWWFAVGTYRSYGGGIPGPNGHIVQSVELHVDCETTPPLPTTTTTTSYPATWVLMFRQTLGYEWGRNQWTKDTGNPDSDNYAILDRLESCRGDDGKFALKLSWPGAGLENQVWKQSSNPVDGNVSGGVEGYEPISVAYTGDHWGGLEKNMQEALFDGQIGVDSLWWHRYAVGAFRAHSRRRHSEHPRELEGPGERGVQRTELYADCKVPPPPPAPVPGNWVLMFRQTMPFLYRRGQWTKNTHDPASPNYAILDRLESCRTEDGKFTMMLKWPHSEKMDQVWRQSSNPVTRGTGGVEGYEAIRIPYEGEAWGGLEYNGEHTLLDGTPNSGHWRFFVGAWHTWSYMIPGPDGRVEMVELYADCAGPPQPPPPPTTTTTTPIPEGKFRCLPTFRCH